MCIKGTSEINVYSMNTYQHELGKCSSWFVVCLVCDLWTVCGFLIKDAGANMLESANWWSKWREKACSGLDEQLGPKWILALAPMQ